jgi:hypothetical protein
VFVVSVSKQTCTLPTIVAPTASAAPTVARSAAAHLPPRARRRTNAQIRSFSANRPGTPSRPIRFTGQSEPGRWTARETNPSHGAWKR